MNTPTIITLDSPKLADLAFQPVQSRLTTDLSWLNHAFGQCERIAYTKDGRTWFKPSLYVGGLDAKQYFDLLPDSHIGNFSFFDVADKRKVEQDSNRQTLEFGLVFWGDFRDVYPNNHTTRTVENIINDVLFSLEKTRVRVTEIKTKAETIFDGYNVNEIDNQFMIRPYFCFRIDGNMKVNQLC